MATLLFAACNNRRQQTTAQVMQRRLNSQEKLVITYRFHTGKEWVYDSTEVDNKIIPHDSLRVSFSPEKPNESSLQIP